MTIGFLLSLQSQVVEKTVMKILVMYQTSHAFDTGAIKVTTYGYNYHYILIHFHFILQYLYAEYEHVQNTIVSV